MTDSTRNVEFSELRNTKEGRLILSRLVTGGRRNHDKTHSYNALKKYVDGGTNENDVYIIRAKRLYNKEVPSDVKYSAKAIKEWSDSRDVSHKTSYKNGGSNDADNVMFEKSSYNRSRKDRNMHDKERKGAYAYNYIEAREIKERDRYEESLNPTTYDPTYGIDERSMKLREKEKKQAQKRSEQEKERLKDYKARAKNMTKDQLRRESHNPYFKSKLERLEREEREQLHQIYNTRYKKGTYEYYEGYFGKDYDPYDVKSGPSWVNEEGYTCYDCGDDYYAYDPNEHEDKSFWDKTAEEVVDDIFEEVGNFFSW